MLSSLHIENIALIRRLDLEPAAGFCAFTGETGAGKSILIDAIGLLCGARSERELIRSGEEYALVEGLFDVSDEALLQALAELDVFPEEDGTVLLRRLLQSDGKSSAKINGRGVPLSILRSVAGLLLHIHGQQDTRGLADGEKQLAVLDAFAKNGAVLAEYGSAYRAFSETKRELAGVLSRAEALAEQADLLRYQVSELNAAKLRPGEEAELLTEHKLLANREKIAENASAAYEALFAGEGSALEKLQTARASLRRLSGIVPEEGELTERLENLYTEITDISDTVRAYTEGGDGSQARLTRVEERLETLSSLQRKYRTDEAGLLEKLAKAKKDLLNLDNADSDREELEKTLSERKEKLNAAAKVLSGSRKEAASLLAERVKEGLSGLDMPKVRFLIDVSPAEPGVSGADEVCFLVSANAGEEPKPIGRIASGGELSRIMLCLQAALADAERMPTLIFDEIDTGISGKTNEKLGRMMASLASDPGARGGKKQVICVTHAAQLAARAEHHYRVSKAEKNGRTETAVEKLDRDGRIGELARIMGGLNVTDTVRKAAAELLDGGEQP